METYREITCCRSCGSERLESILHLGELYISDFVEDMEARRGKAPLELVLCDDCSLLQLKHTTNPELLYREYFYRSAQNPIMVRALEDIAEKAKKLVKLGVGDMVLDIGANNGTLLSFFPDYVIKVGCEPAKNLVSDLSKHVNFVINDYFSYESFKHCRRLGGAEKAKLIFSIAMFYDLDDPKKFVSDVAKCLDKDGVFIIEQRYLPSMLEQNDIGNVVHEHLEFYSLLSLKPLLERYGLEVFDVELNDVNGGSFRVYVQHKEEGFKINPRVWTLEMREVELRLDTKKPYEDFAERVVGIRDEVRDFIMREWERGKHIWVYGASTKGNTVLQYFDLRYPVIEGAAERDPRKVGRKCAGSWIPIISEEESRKRADYFLVLIWFYRNAIIEREKEFLKRGGRLIFPFPEFEVVG